MILGFNYQFNNKFPQGEEDIQAVCNALVDASAQDIGDCTASLTDLLSLHKMRLTLWCERVLLKSGSPTLLEITVEAAKASPAFNEMQVSDLFDACLHFYRSGKIGLVQLEALWAGLIDSMTINNDHAYRNPFYVLGRGLSVAKDVDLKAHAMPRLDLSLARHAASYEALHYQDNVVRPVSWMAYELNVPLTFRKVSGWYNHSKDPSGLVFMVEALAIHGQINSEQLISIAEDYGVRHLGYVFEQVIMYLPKLSNINAFTEAFDESYLFTEKSLKKLLTANKKNCCLSIYNILIDPNFDQYKLPIFSEFVLTATPFVYKGLSVNEVERRSSLRKHNISMGNFNAIWLCELDYYKRHLRSDQQSAVGDSPIDILSALKIARPPEYKLALKAINEIGLSHLGNDLSGANREFVDDFLKFVKMDDSQKRTFMKIFPQAKAQILEEDLGM